MNIVKLFFPILTLPYLTRVLSTDAYGVVTYVKSFIVYVQLVLDFGFLLSATKEIALCKNDINKVGRILGDTIAEKIILAIASTIVYVGAIIYIPILKKYAVFSMLYFFSAIFTIGIFDFMYRGMEKMHLVAIPFTVSKTVTTLLTFLLIHSDTDLILIAGLEIIGSLISTFFSLFFVYKLGIKISFTGIKKWLNDLKESGIYFISNFATTVFGAFTTLISGLYLSLEDIACWGLCMQVLSAAKALYNPITNSLYPHMVQKKDIKFIKKISLFMMIPIAIGCCCVIFGAELVLQIIGGEKYIIASGAFRILLPAFVFSFYSMLYGWPVLGAIGKIKETTITTIAAAAVQIIGLGVLIMFNKFTLVGMAVCCSLSEMSFFLFRYAIYTKNKSLFVME